MKKMIFFPAIILMVVLDRIVKYLTVTHLSDSSLVLINGVFELTFVKNEGALFGMFQGGAVILAVITAVLLVFMVFVLFRIPDTGKMRFLRIICMLIIAGGIGNLIDRVAYGYVIDTFYFRLIDFPVFNVADCYVTVAVFAFLILYIFYYKDEDFDNFLTLRKGQKRGK